MEEEELRVSTFVTYFNAVGRTNYTNAFRILDTLRYGVNNIQRHTT